MFGGRVLLRDKLFQRLGRIWEAGKQLFVRRYERDIQLMGKGNEFAVVSGATAF